MLELVIGGARSGKSAYAEQCAKDSGQDVIYIATATAKDTEMQQRILRHQNERPAHWQTIEEPIQLAKALTTNVKAFVIVDCLTLWMSNILSLSQTEYSQQVKHFFSAITGIQTNVIFVSNEIGMGVVPLGEETRRFIDEMGRLHQALAKACQRVTLITVGIASKIKDE